MENDLLRLSTYLVPGIPLKFYQTQQHYLEEALGCRVSLTVESRWNGPPPERPDPFTANEADIVFMCGASYLRMKRTGKDQNMELLGAAPVHIHVKSSLRPVFFSDVVIRKDRKDIYKSLWDLKGHRWAYNDQESLSGHEAVCLELKKMGSDTTFFSHSVKSGSHLNSLKLLKDGLADVAAIDSSTLVNWLSDRPEEKDEFHTVCSLGPFPSHPIVVRSALPAQTKETILKAFLSMGDSVEWKNKLAEFHVWGFKPVDSSVYDSLEDLLSGIKDKNKKVPYY